MGSPICSFFTCLYSPILCGPLQCHFIYNNLGSRALFFPLSRSARGSSPSTAGLPGPRRPRVPRSAPRARSSESRRARPPRPTRRAREPGRLRSPRAVRACPRPKSAPSGAGAPPALPARPGAGQPATSSAQRRARLRSRTHRLRAAGAPPPAGGPPAARARPRSAGRPWLRGASASAAKAMWPVVRSGGLGRPSLAPPRCAALHPASLTCVRAGRAGLRPAPQELELAGPVPSPFTSSPSCFGPRLCRPGCWDLSPPSRAWSSLSRLRVVRSSCRKA